LDHSILRPDDDICVPLIVVAEYMVGVALAQPAYQPRMRDFLDGLLSVVSVLPYDEETLDTHVGLLAWTIQHGVARGQHDLMIAAAAVVTGRVLMTCDKRARFEELPGLQVDLLG